MSSTWKIAIPVGCTVIIVGAALVWQVHRNRVAGAKLAKTVRIRRSGAEQGNAEAQTGLGYMYFYGKGVPQDYSEALYWFGKAANQGYAKAEDNLGLMYYYSRGVPQDYAEALRWFQKAADQEFAEGEDDLGRMSYYGTGLPRDYAQGLHWIQKSADQGLARGQKDLGGAFFYGAGLPQDYAQALRWYRKAADQGDPSAEYDVGYMYVHGLGGPRSLIEAGRWLRRAAADGDEEAQRAVSVTLTPTLKIILLVQLVAGLAFALNFVSVNYFFVSEGLNTLSQKLTSAAGLLLLICTGFEWYGYTHHKFRCLIYGPNGFDVLRWLLEPASFAPLVYIIRRGRKQPADGFPDTEPSAESECLARPGQT